MNANEQKHPTRVAIVSAAVSFFLSCIFAAYVIGQRTGKLLVIEQWQKETAPRIERIDSLGTLSFQHWKSSYDKEQAQQYSRLQKLEELTSHLEAMELKIDRLERNHNQKVNP